MVIIESSNIDKTFVVGTTNNGLFNAIDRTCIAYTEVEICGIMCRGVATCILCSKSNFLM